MLSLLNKKKDMKVSREKEDNSDLPPTEDKTLLLNSHSDFNDETR
jgi:hypothetical protein